MPYAWQSCRRDPIHCDTARSGRPGHQQRDPAERPAGRTRAYSARPHRDDLRGAAERDRGCRGVVFLRRQRRAAARRIGGAQKQSRDCSGAARSTAHARPAGGRDHAGRRPAPRNDDAAAAVARPHRSRDSARRRRPDPLRRRTRARAGDQALSGRVPSVRRSRGRSRCRVAPADRRQDDTPGGLQRARDTARACGYRAGISAGRRGSAARARRRTARLRAQSRNRRGHGRQPAMPTTPPSISI